MHRLDCAGAHSVFREEAEIAKRIAVLETRADLFVISARLEAVEGVLRERGMLSIRQTPDKRPLIRHWKPITGT